VDFMPLGRLVGDPPNKLSDLLSLVYMAVWLACGTLPWEGCDAISAMAMRVGLRGHPVLCCLPEPVHEFAVAVLDAQADGCMELNAVRLHLDQLQNTAGERWDPSHAQNEVPSLLSNHQAMSSPVWRRMIVG
jgi:hypothetical protein